MARSIFSYVDRKVLKNRCTRHVVLPDVVTLPHRLDGHRLVATWCTRSEVGRTLPAQRDERTSDMLPPERVRQLPVHMRSTFQYLYRVQSLSCPVIIVSSRLRQVTVFQGLHR